MILADENIHGFIIKTLRETGFEVISVTQTAKGIKDENVIQLALQHGYLLLTEDKDFGEWVFAHHVKDLSVLFLRYSFHEYKEIAITLTISAFLKVIGLLLFTFLLLAHPKVKEFLNYDKIEDSFK